MSDIHQRFFTMYLMKADGALLNPGQLTALQAHLADCPTCRADQRIYQGLLAQASQRWQAAPAPVALGKLVRDSQKTERLRWAVKPLRALIFAGVAFLALAVVLFIVTALRPSPAVQPAGIPVPATLPPKSTPTSMVREEGKILIDPMLHGTPYGGGSWSPGGDYFFIPILEMPAPGGDRRIIRLHFISSATGEDCQASQHFAGQLGVQNYAWLDHEHLFFIGAKGRALLFTPCQAGVQDLSDQFPEPLLRAATSTLSQDWIYQGPLLLEAPSAYWLLDPGSLKAHALAEPAPSPEMGDSFAWAPDKRRVAVLQPVAGNLKMSRLWVLDSASGKLLRTMEIEAGNEGRAPFMEWVGSERLLIWSIDPSGPLLIDFSADPPRQARVLPDLLGLNLIYPDQMTSMGVNYSPKDGSYHIAAHINLPDDTSIYLYHGENGRVEKLAGDRQVQLIFAGNQSMALMPLQEPPSFEDSFKVIWVDAPGLAQAELEASGHSPRNSPRLQSYLLPGGSRMLFGSTQGLSMVSFPDGKTLAFWRLAGADNPQFLSLSVSPLGNTAIIIARNNGNQGDLLYWLAPVK